MKLHQQFRPATVFLVLAGVTACSTNPESGRPSVRDMYRHYSRTGEIHAAVIDGNLQGVERPAMWIAQNEGPEGMPLGSERYVERMQRHAFRIAEAETIEAAAVTTARMGQTCGDCHADLGVGPEFPVGTRPTGGDGTAAHMALHHWAADRMWEGLIARSEQAWMAGSEALVGVPLEIEPGHPSREMLAERVHDVARQARRATEWNRRAELYGTFLSTCGACHSGTGG